MVSFHTRNFVAEFIRFKLIFIHKMTNSLFEPLFGGLRGIIRTSYIARWKRVAYFLFTIIELFSLDLTVETL